MSCRWRYDGLDMRMSGKHSGPQTKRQQKLQKCNHALRLWHWVKAISSTNRSVVEFKKTFWKDIRQHKKEKLASKRRSALQTGGGFVNEFPPSQTEEQVQLCINVEQVEGFQGIDYLEKEIKNKREFSPGNVWRWKDPLQKYVNMHDCVHPENTCAVVADDGVATRGAENTSGWNYRPDLTDGRDDASHLHHKWKLLRIQTRRQQTATTMKGKQYFYGAVGGLQRHRPVRSTYDGCAVKFLYNLRRWCEKASWGKRQYR